MKVLMINSVCGIRSTGRICTDLATALEAHGHEVRIAFGRENVPEQFRKYAVRIGTDLDVKLHGVKARLCDADGLGCKNATRNFIKWVEMYNPDVIHLHNLHGYYINVPVLFKYIIENKKKVIWTLHDCWVFTGHSGTCDLVKCEKWLTGCGKCPLSKEYPKSYIDRSRYNYIWKKSIFLAVEDITFITPSRWLAGLVKKSFLRSKAVKVIPNGIDINQFRPLENDFRREYGVEDKIMLLGCASAWGEGKGLEDFKILSNRLDERFSIVLVGITEKLKQNMPSNIICIKKTQSAKELAQIYSSADLFINLSYVDVFSMVNREALLCGTPVLTYNTGGCAECIKDNDGIYFEKGDIDGVVHFLMNDYHTKSFKVNLPNNNGSELNNDPASTQETAQGYLSLMTNRGGGYFYNRKKYKLMGKNMILGVAASWGQRKGLDVFLKLAEDLSPEFEIFMVGFSGNGIHQIPERIHAIPQTESVNALRDLYCVADVFLNPTVQDNFPTVNLESVACCTPVITYRTGGSPENSFTPTCVVEQNDYDTIYELLINRKYENALQPDARYLIGKECMCNLYLSAYEENKRFD